MIDFSALPDLLVLPDTIRTATWLIIPLIAAGVGWFTNYIAIKLLFHPRQPKRFLWLTFHGVFPKRQKELGLKLGELFANTLGVQSRLEEVATKAIDLESLEVELRNKIQSAALDLLKAQFPMALALIPPALLEGLSQTISGKIRIEIEERLSAASAEVATKIDVKEIVSQEISKLDSDSLELMLKGLLKSEFRFIELSGAVLGFLIGCIQVIISVRLLN